MTAVYPWYLHGGSYLTREAIMEGVKDAYFELTRPWVTYEQRIHWHKIHRFSGKYEMRMVKPIEAKEITLDGVADLVECEKVPIYDDYIEYLVLRVQIMHQRRLSDGKVSAEKGMEEVFARYDSREGFDLAQVRLRWPNAYYEHCQAEGGDI